MLKYIVILLAFWASALAAPVWNDVPDETAGYYRLYSAQSGSLKKWVGYPDPNYTWSSGNLSWKRQVTDELGKKRTITTYKEPFGIIANFESASRVSGANSEVEVAVARRFGSLKDFVWLDKVSGGGMVIFPGTGEHIFLIRNKDNPIPEEIYTEGDNYYEVIEGKTYIHVKSFSGVGMAAGTPSVLVGHWKMNENTASDNDELVTNGAFAADTDWTKGTGWTIAGGVASCDGSQTASSSLYQDMGIVAGRKYKVVFTISSHTAGQVRVNLGGSAAGTWRNSDGTYSEFIVAVGGLPNGYIGANSTFVGDIDDVSVKLCAAEDSSGNDHDGLLQEDTSAAHVTGKINGAFDFDGSADYIEIADHADFTPALTPFSISAWVYMHDASNFWIASKGVYNTDGEWVFWTSSADKIYIDAMDESVDNCRIGRVYNTALTAYQNQWIHLVGTYDGGILSSGFKIYLNGVRVDDTNYENNAGSFVTIENLTHAVWIGRYDTDYTDGLIDNVMIFSTELSQDDVNILYNGGSGTEIPAELNSQTLGRRGNLSPLPLRRRYEN